MHKLYLKELIGFLLKFICVKWGAALPTLGFGHFSAFFICVCSNQERNSVHLKVRCSCEFSLGVCIYTKSCTGRGIRSAIIVCQVCIAYSYGRLLSMKPAPIVSTQRTRKTETLFARLSCPNMS